MRTPAGLLMAIVALCVATIAGCGYTTRSYIAEQYSSVYIEPVVNKIDVTRETSSGNRYRIYQPGLETDITRSLVRRFLLDGNLKPVQAGAADLTLTTQLVDFRRDALRYDKNDDVLEYRINIVVAAKLSNSKNGTLLWQEDQFTGSYTYFVSGPQAKTETAAIDGALDDLARRVVERTVEQW